MTAIHIEFLYSLKVMRMRHRRAGCKQLWGGSSSRTKPHQGEVEVAVGSAGERRGKRKTVESDWSISWDWSRKTKKKKGIRWKWRREHPEWEVVTRVEGMKGSGNPKGVRNENTWEKGGMSSTALGFKPQGFVCVRACVRVSVKKYYF